MTKGTGDLRILGASDGYAHALISLRAGWIGPLARPGLPGIHPHHVRKIAARDAKLKPLREFEEWLMQRHADCQAAYKKTCDNGVSEDGK